MKKHTYTFGSIIILIIVIFAFIILTPTGFLSGGKNDGRLPEFGSYNGKSIRYEKDSLMAKEVSYNAQMLQSRGVELNDQSYYYIFNGAFQQAVLATAYQDEVENSGYTVPVSAVNRIMMNYFMENGVYSPKLYKQADENDKRDLRNSIEQDLTTTRFIDDVFGSNTDLFGTTGLYGVKESDAELDFLASYNEEKRGFNMAAFAFDSYPEEMKLAYGKDNPSKFVKYDLSAITLEDKSTAKTVANRLANSEISFEDAVTEYGQRVYVNSEGNLLYKFQYQIENILTNKDDITKLSALGMGDVSDIIQTETGFTLFMANTTAKEADFTDSDTIKQVSTYISVFEQEMTETYFTERAKAFKAAAANNFDAACKEFGVESKTISPFPLNYGNTSVASKFESSESALYGADTNETFLKTAFSLNMNEVSEPIVMNNNVVVLQYTTKADSAESEPHVDDVDKYAISSYFLNNKKLKNNFDQAYSKL